MNILIYLSGKRARKNLNDNARNEKEIESLIPKEEERPLTGVILDLLSPEKNPEKKPGFTLNNFSNKLTVKIFSRFFKLLCKYNSLGSPI